MLEALVFLLIAIRCGESRPNGRFARAIIVGIETIHVTTGTWLEIRCDDCGAYLEKRPGDAWRCRFQATALAHLWDQGWELRGDSIACSSCTNRNPAQTTSSTSDAGGTGRNFIEPQSWVTGKLLGFDLETTGTDAFSDVPVSYSLLQYYGRQRIDANSRIVNPGREIPEGAIAVHGITNERAVREGCALDEAITDTVDTLVRASLQNIPVVGMNVSYDLKMINACAKRVLGISLTEAGWDGPVLDVLVIDRHFDKYRKGGRKLVDLCEHYGVDTSALHDAQNDVEATVAVLFKQCEKYPELASTSLKELHEHQKEWHAEWAENLSLYFMSKGKEPLAPTDLMWPVAPVL